MGFFTALLIKSLNKPKSSNLNTRALIYFFLIYMKSRETNHKKWSLQLSKGHKHNRTGHLTRQSVQERATGTNKTPRCMTQEPERPVNPSQGGPVHLGIISFAQPSEPTARCFCHAFGHCTLWAHGTAGMAKSSLQGQGLWAWSATPQQQHFFFSCVLHRETFCLSSTEILQISLYHKRNKIMLKMQ